jgi:sec-independent protein translocase protein TatB
MFDIGWSEMAVVAVVALVVIGPKDLPKLLRTVGQWTGKARALAREFQSHLDDLARQSELDELKKQAEAVTRFDVKEEIANTIDPGGELKKAIEESDPAKLAAAEPLPPPTLEPTADPQPVDAPRPGEPKA